MKFAPRTILDRFRAVLSLARRAYAPYKLQIFALTGLGLVSGILEGIGINVLIPLLTFVLETPDEATDAISNTVRTLFHAAGIDFAPKFLLIFVVLLFLIRSVVLLFLYYTQIRIMTDYEADTRSRLLKAMLHTSWSNLTKQRMGDLESWLLIDIPASVTLLRNLSASIMLITSLFMYLFVAFNISPPIMLTTIGLGALVLIGFLPIVHYTRTLSAGRAATFSDMSHWVSEHMLGIKTIKASAVENNVQNAGQALFGRLRDFNRRVTMLSYVTSIAIPPLGILFIAGVFALAFRTDIISIAALPAIVYLIYRIATYVQQLQSSFQNMNEQAPHLQRILQYTAEAEQNAEVNTGKRHFSFEKELCFENVSFSYERTVLSNVTFSVPHGSFVGIIGPSGAGKTTCVDMILRLLAPRSGRILLDGIDSREFDISEWRSHIGYVSQDFFLLNDSIRNNIAFFDRTITDENIWQAAELAHIADVVRKSPHGLDTRIGDRGLSLSAGQRQRLVIARALAHNPDILILDEATSALDAESEQHIKRIIEELKGKITIIAVAHRLSTIVDADLLLALEEGKVVEVGPPQELLKDKESYFFKVNSIT
jgi:ABC-type multidrug transport system fused ATPase/permease subunit